MSVLDQVNDMQKSGVSERKIMENLQEQGVSPKEIKDALSQSQIKNAISGGNQNTQENPRNAQQSKRESYENELNVPSPSKNNLQTNKFSPQTQDISQLQQNQSQGNYPPSSQPQYSNTGNYGGYAQQEYDENQYTGYEDQGYYDNYGSYDNQGYGSYTDTDTMIEISEQVFAEKLKPHLKKLEENSKFKSLTETKIDNISARLERLESQIDKLQSAILEKVGGYGRGLENVKKEMKMVEESFSKMAAGLQGKTKKTSTRKSKTKSKTKNKKSSSKKHKKKR